jgi:hypothetical protein
MEQAGSLGARRSRAPVSLVRIGNGHFPRVVPISLVEMAPQTLESINCST